MKNCLILSALVLLLSCATTPPATAPEPQTAPQVAAQHESSDGTAVPGTAVMLRPPAGFVLTDRFPGFLQESTSSSIMVTEIPGPYGEVTRGITDAELAGQKGMTILSNTEAEVDGHPAILLQVEQQAHGLEFKKWIVAVDLAPSTTLIVASYPAATAADQEEPLREAVLGATFGQRSDPLEALAFTATPVAPLEVAHVMGQNLVLSHEGQFPVGEGDPLMVIGLSASQGLEVPDKESFAEQRVKQVVGIENVTVVQNEPVTIAGLPGYTTTATGTGARGEIPLTIFQVILFGSSDYCLIQGITPSASSDTYLPLFKQIANSFEMKKQGK